MCLHIVPTRSSQFGKLSENQLLISKSELRHKLTIINCIIIKVQSWNCKYTFLCRRDRSPQWIKINGMAPKGTGVQKVPLSCMNAQVIKSSYHCLETASVYLKLEQLNSNTTILVRGLGKLTIMWHNYSTLLLYTHNLQNIFIVSQMFHINWVTC